MTWPPSGPFDDFDVNAVGTLNLLEATGGSPRNRRSCFMSTNKVYGDAPNELPLVEMPTRWGYARAEDYNGISEDMRIDRQQALDLRCLQGRRRRHGPGVRALLQMPTVCFRGGCLTGPDHSAANCTASCPT